jgi:hypothetical protein
MEQNTWWDTMTGDTLFLHNGDFLKDTDDLLIDRD